MLEHKDEKIEKAYKVLHYLSSDPDTVRMAELREKAIWDEVSRMNGAINEGLQKGLQQGLEQGIQQGIQQGIEKGKLEIVHRLLAKEYSPEDIADLTGLDVETIYKLKKN